VVRSRLLCATRLLAVRAAPLAAPNAAACKTCTVLLGIAEESMHSYAARDEADLQAGRGIDAPRLSDWVRGLLPHIGNPNLLGVSVTQTYTSPSSELTRNELGRLPARHCHRVGARARCHHQRVRWKEMAVSYLSRIMGYMVAHPQQDPPDGHLALLGRRLPLHADRGSDHPHALRRLQAALRRPPSRSHGPARRNDDHGTSGCRTSFMRRGGGSDAATYGQAPLNLLILDVEDVGVRPFR
jgi:hypothetical protein